MPPPSSQRGFDRLAPIYRPLEHLLAGRVMQRARTCHLGSIVGPRQVLILGEGPGRLLEVLVTRWPTAEITVLEQSARMIEVAQSRLRNLPGLGATVHFRQCDVRAVELPPSTFDVILTPFILDCFPRPELESLVRRIATASAPSAQWLHTDFHLPEAGWRRTRARCIHRLMYSFFNYATKLPARSLHPPDEALGRADFRLQARSLYNAGLIRADFWHRAGK